MRAEKRRRKREKESVCTTNEFSINPFISSLLTQYFVLLNWSADVKHLLMDGSWFDQACGLCRACGSEPDHVAASVWTCYTQVPGHELKVYYRRKNAVRLWLDWVTEWRSHSEKQAYNKDCVKVSNEATSVDGQVERAEGRLVSPLYWGPQARWSQSYSSLWFHPASICSPQWRCTWPTCLTENITWCIRGGKRSERRGVHAALWSACCDAVP